MRREGKREQKPWQQQLHLHPWPLHQNAAAWPHTYCYHFNRVFLESLWPYELRSSICFTRAEQCFEPLLHVIHEIFGRVRVVEEVLSDYEVHLALWLFGTAVDRR